MPKAFHRVHSHRGKRWGKENQKREDVFKNRLMRREGSSGSGKTQLIDVAERTGGGGGYRGVPATCTREDWSLMNDIAYFLFPQKQHGNCQDRGAGKRLGFGSTEANQA